MGDVSDLTNALGQRVVAGRRGRFLAADGTDVDGGFLELTLESGDVVVLDVAGDWTLTARPGPWVDHFAEPLTNDNREFVRRHGKWSAVDLPPEEAEALVGALIGSASLIHNEMNEVEGVRLVTPAAIVVARQWGGELQVEVQRG